MYSDGLLKLPIFIIQKNFKILLTVYSLSPHINKFMRRQRGKPAHNCLVVIIIAKHNNIKSTVLFFEVPSILMQNRVR